MSEFSGKFVKVSEASPHVFLVELNRKPLNAFSKEFWVEYGEIFDKINLKSHDVRAIVISSANPKIFTAGIDFQSFAEIENFGSEQARRAYHSREYILAFQNAINAPGRCPFPVIAAVHGPAIGLGVDIISACDVRYASSDATFSIKEVNFGLAADIGTLAYLPKITSNDSLARELAYTAQTFSAAEAAKLGLVSKVVDGGREGVVKSALDLARLIATKSPIAIASTKQLLNHSRDHSVSANLEYTSIWNGAMIHTADLKQAAIAQATKSKESPSFQPLRKVQGKL
ncbi:hypothetical protein PILCRDRAFT_824262 [Piloderma croceum F 1598]|uniref:Enoyl-CoA hydratase n=1 Tax=Piloderma croceum (strain F 1598) TaxID=765440 RepID=A0A0C3BMX4_PILCF|nr:hypothetical protein PILCRDRAFT_824262 [Piloderma croceum F 1598]